LLIRAWFNPDTANTSSDIPIKIKSERGEFAGMIPPCGPIIKPETGRED
jgi:hypothetical protein